MESIRQPNELILTGNLTEHWKKFKLYLIATGLDNKSEEQKIALLLHVAKSSAIEVYNTFTFDSTKHLIMYLINLKNTVTQIKI